MHWRRKWQPTTVFLPGESQGWGSLVGCRLWGRIESDTTEVTQQQENPSRQPVINTSMELDHTSLPLYILFHASSRLFQTFCMSNPDVTNLFITVISFNRIFCIIIGH